MHGFISNPSNNTAENNKLDMYILFIISAINRYIMTIIQDKHLYFNLIFTLAIGLFLVSAGLYL